MSNGLGDEVKRTFKLATLRRESEAIKTGPQWERTRGIKERCQRLRDQENKLYNQRYLTRTEVARKELMHKAGQKSLGFKPRFGMADRFDKSALLRQAQRQVRAQHRGRLTLIDREETRLLEKEMKRSRSENRIQGKARDAFNKTVDRRGHGERRQSRSRSRNR